VSLDAVQALRECAVDLFQVWDTTLDEPEVGHVRFRGRFLVDPAVCFDDLRARYEQYGFTPTARPAGEGVALVAIPTVFRATPTNNRINLLLFVATILSTLFVGAGYAAETVDEMWQIWRGWPFSLTIMLILGAHEMGHYIAARYHKVPVTLPYFIPLPIPYSFGTMGAVIRLKGPVTNRRSLLDVGAAGPWAGMLFAVPLLLVGLATSPVGPLPQTGYTMEGNSILYALTKILVYGRFLPSGGLDVQLNQVAWAAWVGLLVTSLNLIPLGQLDGGHIASVLFGDKAKQLFWPIIISLVILVVVTGTTTWILWVFILFFLGRTYAEPLDQVTQLDPRRRLIAILSLCLFVLVFVPVPLQIVGP
jgi:membrane-associated protease RseP (regulator of RpoE activity)